MQEYNFARAYNRPQESIAPWDVAPQSQPPLPYEQYGYVPNVAQQLQSFPFSNFVKGQSYFSQSDYSFANWFTTRVHLTPIGVVTNG